VGTRYDLAVPGTVMGAGLELMGVLKKALPADTEEDELGGPGGTGWREARARGDEIEWVGGKGGKGGKEGKEGKKGSGKGKGGGR
jgi:hypothetical protein